MMKKTIAILLALLMVLGMVVACAKPATEAPKTEEPKAAEAGRGPQGYGRAQGYGSPSGSLGRRLHGS